MFGDGILGRSTTRRRLWESLETRLDVSTTVTLIRVAGQGFVAPVACSVAKPAHNRTRRALRCDIREFYIFIAFA